MLVLSREISEDILIGNDVVVRVMDIRNGRRPSVRLGIEAPKHISVDRREVREVKKEMNEVSYGEDNRKI